MCSLIIDKKLDWPKDLDSLILLEFISFYNMSKKTHKMSQTTNHLLNYNKYKDPQNW